MAPMRALPWDAAVPHGWRTGGLATAEGASGWYSLRCWRNECEGIIWLERRPTPTINSKGAKLWPSAKCPSCKRANRIGTARCCRCQAAVAHCACRNGQAGAEAGGGGSLQRWMVARRPKEEEQGAPEGREGKREAGEAEGAGGMHEAEAEADKGGPAGPRTGTEAEEEERRSRCRRGSPPRLGFPRTSNPSQPLNLEWWGAGAAVAQRWVRLETPREGSFPSRGSGQTRSSGARQT